MRYTNYRGLAQVANWVRLKFAAMNLKKFAIRKKIDERLLSRSLDFHYFSHNFLQIFKSTRDKRVLFRQSVKSSK